jgi:hypothetical protein
MHAWALPLRASFLDQGCPGLLVFLFGHPELMKGAQGGEDGASDPCTEAPFYGEMRGNDLDFLLGHLKGELLVDALIEAREEGGPPSEDDIRKEIPPDVRITPVNRLPYHVDEP